MIPPGSATDLVAALEHHADVVSWINDTLDIHEHDTESSLAWADLPGLDHHITELLAALDIACEDASGQLEHIMSDVSRGIPRLTYDLHFMRDSALGLQGSLSSVLRGAHQAVPTEMGAVLDTLRQLDTVKTRMEAAREVLREAESWGSLEHEVTALISEQNYAQAAERLAEASKSMTVFQNTPDYEPRRTLMVNLQNELEASLSSALVTAINAHNVVVCKDYYSVFSMIQREAEFRNYYNASRRSTLLEMWQSAALVDCERGRGASPSLSTKTFVDFLGQFYSNFSSILNTERNPICSIFPDPVATLSQFISTTLSSLQPTFAQRLSSLSEHYGDACVSHLIAVLRATEDFAISVDLLVEKIRYAARPTAGQQPSIGEKPSHLRRRSSRMSMSWRPKTVSSDISLTKSSLDIEDYSEWCQELFQPFLDFQVDYASLERRFLDRSLCKILSNDLRDVITDVDRPRLLRDRAVEVFGVAEGSLARCKAFTHGYGAVGLVRTLDGFFQSFFDGWTADIQTTSSSIQYPAQNAFSDGDLDDLDYTAQDWATIQKFLHLLTSSRTVFDRMMVYENKLRTFLQQIGAQFKLVQGDPNKFSIGVTRGESLILDQSTLNSSELFSLLESADPDHARDHLSSTSGARNAPGLLQEAFLVDARKALFEFAQTCQIALHETILSPLRKHLASYASSPVWSAIRDPRTRTSPNDLQVPTFSLSPSDTVQRVVEGLLNLPRLFEVYADDDALAFSLFTLPHIDTELVRGFVDQNGGDAAGKGSAHRRLSVVNLKPTTLDPATVSSAWLYSLGHSFLQYLVLDILSNISHLTTAGAAQLLADLEYLSNNVRVLNVEHDGLEKWITYVGMDNEEGRKVISESASADPILMHIKTLRRW